ncbi:hypothetical protein M422DRAFT_275812 [Sphaerobolus stellatus SS14]|uniref:Uncharacterized protein n=1 Tax=Sphaerobolus stellatus (strain SS14) TaxID=990650 RepID=A0A0C9TNU9_SPHS4|nr:hypothetical protein M422DRAFT_275812 [Sphaerobolus stellatus SS14]
MGGIVEEDVMLDSLIALALAPPYNGGGRDGFITVNGLLRLLRVLAVSQGQGKTGEAGIGPNIDTLNIRKLGLRFRHLGIPKAEKGYFEDCIKASHNVPLTEQEAIQV